MESIGESYDLVRENFQQNFILNRYGPVKGIRNKVEMKTSKNTTLLRNDARKGKEENYPTLLYT